MAEGVLFDVAVGLISKLGSPALKELGLRRGLTDELDKLKGSVATIEPFLLHAEEQYMENPEVKLWLGFLGEAMYDADDLLDEIGGSKIPKKVRLFFSKSNQFSVGLRMGHKVKAIRERLDEIAANRMFHLEERSMERVFVANDKYLTYFFPPGIVVGREHEKESIVERLLSSDYEENVSVVSIVGMGGLGKSTLAQLVYNDDRVMCHFDLKMWILVPDDFDVKLMVKKVIESARGEIPESPEMDRLNKLLHERIDGRRYLLVLDDVWNEDLDKWVRFKDLLGGGAFGSKILITTRLRNVAEMSRPIFIHELGDLSKNEAWSLFRQMALQEGPVPDPIREAIGREIVEKCAGVPLAIKHMGGMLRFKRTREWLLFKNEKLSHMLYDYGILATLKLSYNRLPSHYKHCFACCSLYPKDYEFRVEQLIHLWMAQGYLKLTHPNQHYQDVGFQCFMDLCRSSFFQDAKRDMFGNIVSCKMHDLMHALAISVGGDNFSTSHSKMTCINDKTQHISYAIDGNSILQDFSSLLKAKRVRTLILFAGRQVHIEEDQLHAVFCNLRCLRMLDLSHTGIDLLPNSICKLKLLRYLDISHNEDIKKLPDSITNLQNLQGLELSFCTKLIHLPKNITKLVNLGHLVNHVCNALTHMPRGIGQLTRLGKLSTFVIAKDNSISKHCGGLDELHSLNNLRGRLTIKNLRYVKNIASEFKAADLSAKQHLEELSLEWNEYADDNDNHSENDVANDEMGLEALRPHHNLKSLSVFSYRGVRSPSWLPWLPNLVNLRLERCCNCVQLPRLGGLPHLEFLKMNHMGNVKHIDNEFYGIDRGGSSSGYLRLFPALKSLSISWMENLTDWISPSDGNNVVVFPCLENLSIQSCAKLTCFPMSDLSELVKLEIRDCEELRLLFNKQQSFPSLTSLSIAGCSKLTDLPNWLLSCVAFNQLSVRRCEWLIVIPEDLGNVRCLTSLEIYCCKRLRYFPEEILCKLTQLQNLSIGAFSEELDDFRYLNGNEDLPCLKELEIWGSDFFGREMCSLPNQLQHLTALRSLKIMGFTTMEALPEWLMNLQSLQSLSLDYCRHLGWQSTATIIQCLPNLMHLNINCCPILEESKSEWLESLDTTRIKVEFSHVSKVRIRLGY